MPCWFYYIEEFNFPNNLNNFNWSDFFIPIPLSITSKISFFVSMWKSTLIFIDPLFVNFNALETKLIKIYLIRLSSEYTVLGRFNE